MAALRLWLRQNQICFFLLFGQALFSLLSAPALAVSTESADLCPSVAADTPPLSVAVADGSRQFQQFANDQGVLRWWSLADRSAIGELDLLSGRNMTATALAEPVTSALSWLTLGSAKAQLTAPDHSGDSTKALSTQASARHHTATGTASERGQLLAWFDPRSQRQQVALVQAAGEAEVLWQSQAYPPLAGGEVPPAAPALYYYRWQQQLIPVALHHADPASRSRLQLQDARTGEALVNWPLSTTSEPAQLLHLQRLVAAPAALDKNLDGGIDRIYLLDQSGQLLRLDPANGSVPGRLALVADLSDSGWQFSFNMQVSRALLATAWLAPAASALPAATASGSPYHGQTQLNQSLQQAGDVLVLLAKQQQQYKLLVLLLPDQRPAGLIRWQDLVAVSSSQPDNSITAATSSAAVHGWWTTLPAAPVSLPAILAGVIYQPLSSQSMGCKAPKLATQLLALHLYQGSAVYQQALLSLPAATPAWLELVLLADERLGLAAAGNGPLLLEGVRGITPQCPRCTELLSAQQFPAWQRLSSFQHEQGAY